MKKEDKKWLKEPYNDVNIDFLQFYRRFGGW